jgi:hypothetical protein
MTISPNPKLILGADFLTAFSRLPKEIQKKARLFLDKFTNATDAPSIHLEKIQAAADARLRSARIDKNYRGILFHPLEGNLYVLLWVDKHDAAYDWAERRTCAINPTTGAIQIVLATEEPVVPKHADTAPPPPFSTPEPVEERLFDGITEDDLLGLGVPDSLLAAVRDVASEQDLNQLEFMLPRDAFEAVFMLAAGYSVEETRAELGIDLPEQVDTTDFERAIERAGSQRQFVVITDAAEMESILSAPLEQWRVFLHPSQRRLVQMQARGPVRVLGSAGTGKTVVAMHRAAWLARHHCGSGEKILFTTFTRNLAADISENLKKLCDHATWERIEVKNLDAWVHRFLEQQQFGMKVAYQDPVRDDLWAKAVSLIPSDPPYTDEFLRAEWDNVIQAHGIEERSTYLTVSRAGRSNRLSRSQRAHIWPVFEEYRALLNEKGLCEPADAFRAASKLIEEHHVTFPYRATIVDEAQDFGNEAFRLVRAIVPRQDNDLFIVGDAHQRIYGQQVVLSRCGIDIRGRGKKLRINYRTTEEIKNWATNLLQGLPFDDLDNGADDLLGIRSVFHGEDPMLVTSNSVTSAAEAVNNHLAALLSNNDTPPESICVVAQSHRLLQDSKKYVLTTGLDVHEIKQEKADNNLAKGIRLATIHRVKGIEFDHMIVVGHFPDTTDEAKPDDRSLRQRALYYVACTRARKSLFVCRIQ